MRCEMRMLLICGSIALLAIAGCGEEQAVEYSANQIAITGNGTASAEPDLAVIVAGVDYTMDDPAEAVDSAAETAEAFMQAARDLGVEDADMQTSYYNLYVEQEYDPYTYTYTGETVYHVQHYVRFKVRETEQVGEVLSAVIGAGANSVSSVSFTVEDQSSLSDAAYLDAVRDAEHRATLMADAMGVTLGEVRYVSQYGSAYPIFESSTVSLGAIGGSYDYSAPPISSGSFRMTAQISVTYAIE